MMKFKTLEEAKQYVKDNTDLEEWIAQDTKIERSSSGPSKARCPLPGHEEKTASFNINSHMSEPYFWCFGCSRGGDIFKYLEYTRGMPFFEALKMLAEKLGVELPRSKGKVQDKKVTEKKERGLELMNRSQQFFSRQLLESQDPEAVNARAYLRSRGISLQQVKTFGLGWAPAQNQLSAKVQKADKELLCELGVLRDYSGRVYDFFQSRLMIPIADAQARVVAFSGRNLGEVTAKNPKYKNSPETFIFKKKQSLYGLSFTQKLLRQKEYVVIVEGFFDQWALFARGIPSVAVMGTALTADHLKILGRYTDQVILMLDNDEAGLRSTLRSLPLLLENNFESKVFEVPGGKDPDEWLKSYDGKNPSAVEAQILEAREGLEWWAAHLIVEGQKAHKNALQICKSLADLWKLTPNKAHENFLAQRLAPMLSMGAGDFIDSMNSLVTGKKKSNAPSDPMASRESSAMRATAAFARTRRLNTPLERSAEALLSLVMANWSQLAPKSHSDWDALEKLFRFTPMLEIVKGLGRQVQLAHGDLDSKGLMTLASSGTLGEGFESLVLKAVVGGQSRDAEKSEISKGYRELSTFLEKENLKLEMLHLRQEMQKNPENAQETARLLHEIGTQLANYKYLEKQ